MKAESDYNSRPRKAESSIFAATMKLSRPIYNVEDISRGLSELKLNENEDKTVSD